MIQEEYEMKDSKAPIGDGATKRWYNSITIRSGGILLGLITVYRMMYYEVRSEVLRTLVHII